MMVRFLVVVLLALGLGACASQQRTEPPAPIVTAGKQSAPATKAPAAAPPPVETVEVYAYRPPSSAPDATAPVDGGLRADGTSPVSESAAEGAAASAPSGSVPGQGASTVAPPTAGSAPAPQVVAYAPPPPPAPGLPPAADALAKQAEQQRQGGDYVGAAATLERALRIDPQEAYLWNRLARVRMDQGHYSQAGDLASRSNSLSRDQVQLKQDNWSIIAVARRSAGNSAGAMEAEQKARGG
jgi:hypothetical protein